MLHQRYSVLCLCVIAIACCGTATGQARLAVDQEIIWIDPNDPNVRTAEPPREIERYVTVSNKGNSTLTIGYVGTTCGCVSSIRCPKVVEAGGSGKIELRIDKASLLEALEDKQQRLYFVTNDPDREDLFITVFMKGQQERKKEDVSISRSEISRYVSVEELRSSIVREQIFVFDRWDKDLKLSDFASSPNIALSSYDIIYRCPQGIESHFYRLEPRLLSIGEATEIDAWIQFATNHPEYPLVKIPIRYRCTSMIRVSPKVLIFNSRKNEVVKMIKLESLGDKTKDLMVKQIACDEPWLSVKACTISTSAIEYAVSLQPVKDGAGAGEGLRQSRIVFEIDQPEANRVIEVKVMVIR